MFDNPKWDEVLGLKFDVPLSPYESPQFQINDFLNGILALQNYLSICINTLSVPTFLKACSPVDKRLET